MGNSVIYIMGTITVLTGLGFVITAIVNNRRVKSAESWPVVPGTVLSSSVKEFVTRSNGVTTHSYEPVIKYQYVLMGTPYEGKRISFGSPRVNFNEAQKTTDKYSSGSPVQVHYNPNKPAESVLELIAKGSTAFLVLGVIFLVIGAILLLLQLF